MWRTDDKVLERQLTGLNINVLGDEPNTQCFDQQKNCI